MAKLTILAKSERNGQKSQNGHAKNRMALLTLLALLVSMDLGWVSTFLGKCKHFPGESVLPL